MREDATRHITELSSIYPEMKSLLDQLAAVKTGLDAISEGN
jgi:hypothetical protein